MRVLSRLAARELRRGRASPEERLLAAMMWLGPTAPLDELALRAGVSRPGTAIDSARKQGRRVFDRLLARGIVYKRDVRRPFGDCTHVTTPGTKGRLECQALRKAAGLRCGCVAHHGFTVRALVPGLTPRELEAGLDLSDVEVTRRVERALTERADERALCRRQGNDVEGRRWRGEASARGPRGTNHTSPRYAARRIAPAGKDVPPIPPEGLTGNETIPSSLGLRGDTADAPSAPGVSPAARSGTPAAGTRGTEGGRARTGPPSLADIARIEDARRTSETRAWFLALWAAEKLPPLSVDERRKTMWLRAKEFRRDELALAVRRAKAIARTRPASAFRAVFCDPFVLREIIHDEAHRDLAALDPSPRVRATHSSDHARNTAVPRSLADQLAFWGTVDELAARGVDAASLLPRVEGDREDLASLRAKIAALEGRGGPGARQTARAQLRAKRRRDPS